MYLPATITKADIVLNMSVTVSLYISADKKVVLEIGFVDWTTISVVVSILAGVCLLFPLSQQNSR